MRICRIKTELGPRIAFYLDSVVVPLSNARKAFEQVANTTIDVPENDDLLELLPPHDSAISSLAQWVVDNLASIPSGEVLQVENVEFLLPIPRPNKLFLLAGNYAAHVEEGGDQAVERAQTFPYVFMKPPTTTLRPAGTTVPLPTVSPAGIDYEIELAVIIGRGGKGISEATALSHVAGYTIINDLSDRRFRPTPDRRERDRDKFFDWLHGKWHDGFCPCGPCVVSADTIADPQNLDLQLRVNGEVRQNASTSHQIFPVAAVIEFISSFVTLEPGDIIATGTPAGVGAPRGIFLAAGDRIEASIESIATLTTNITE